MNNALLRDANRQALSLRRLRGISRDEPANPFDLAASVGVEQKFLNVKTLEGMFAREPSPCILLPSTQHRPYGRISFSCAHELGHFQLGHATTVDKIGELVELNRSDELAANTFASWLLMPRQAVLVAFECRSIEPSEANAVELLTIAGELGVSLDALTNHMVYSLGMCNQEWLKRTSKISVKDICVAAIGERYSDRTLFIDEFWRSKTIDLEVGDRVVFLSKIRIGGELHCMQLLETPTKAGSTFQIYAPTTPGSFQLALNDNPFVLRISRRHYTGSYKYRYLPDEEGE